MLRAMKPTFLKRTACRLTTAAAVIGLAFLMLGGPGTAAHPVADEMAKAAQRFLDSMDPALRAKATFEFKDDERLNWHFVPKDRKGSTLREMNAEQKDAALRLLATGLSHRGYEQATNIMSLESVLADLEGPNRRFPRDPFLYHFLIFGKPDAKGTWGWRAEGHHFSASFTIVNGELFASTPSFMGTNPAEVRKGPRTGLRVLAAEEDLARKLMTSLDAHQRDTAVFTNVALKEIVTEAKRKVGPLPEKGIAHGALTAPQRAQLRQLVEQYVNRVRPELAKTDLARIEKAGWDKVSFAWAGGLERGQGHYYRVQGPTFLLEYDNTQNDNNHIHAAWRDLENDFGEDLLQKHYRDHAHAK
jgi:hypothetical protein